MRLKRLMKRPALSVLDRDVSPLSSHGLLVLVQDLRRLISVLDTFNQLGRSQHHDADQQETLLPLFGALALVGFSLYLSANTSTGFARRRSAPRASGESHRITSR